MSSNKIPNISHKPKNDFSIVMHELLSKQESGIELFDDFRQLPFYLTFLHTFPVAKCGILRFYKEYLSYAMISILTNLYLDCYHVSIASSEMSFQQCCRHRNMISTLFLVLYHFFSDSPKISLPLTGLIKGLGCLDNINR